MDMARQKSAKSIKNILVLCILAILVGANLVLSSVIESQKQAELSGQGATAMCFVNTNASHGSCLSVTTSPYAWTFGISNSVIGIIAFSVLEVMVLCALALQAWPAASGKRQARMLSQRRVLMLRLIALALWIGSAWALYLIALQAFVLGEYCTFCLIIDTITIACATLVLVLFRHDLFAYSYTLVPRVKPRVKS